MPIGVDSGRRNCPTRGGDFYPHHGSLNYARGWATANLLNNGLVLLAGGYDPNGSTLASAELYRPGQSDLYPHLGRPECRARRQSRPSC